MTVRDNTFEKESSGSWLAEKGRLDQSDLDLLNRNGLVWRTDVLYRIDVGKKHRFEPSFRYTLDNRNGSAIASSGYFFKLTYLYISKAVVLDFVALIGERQAKEVHPVFNAKYESDRLGLALNAIFKIKHYKTSRLSVFAGFEYLDEVANIDFYFNDVRWFNAGILWRHLP